MWLNHTPLKAFLPIELNSDLRRCLTFKAFFCNVTHRHSLRFRPSHLSTYCCLSGHRFNRRQCHSICKAFLPVSTCQLFLWIPPPSWSLSRFSKASCGLFIFWILINSCLQFLLYHIWSCVIFSMCVMCLMAPPTFTLTTWIDTKLPSSLGHKSV